MFTTIDGVIAEMERRWNGLERRGDWRAVFAAAYLATTEHVRRAARGGEFSDTAWVVRIDCDFAQRYFDAFDADEAGRPCPPPWAIAFAASRDQRTFVAQDLLLGMNAHITYDLAFALRATIAVDAPRAALARHRRDHERLNDVLAEAIDDVQRRAAWRYDPGLMAADGLLGRLDEILAAHFIRAWRSRVWEQFMRLHAARRDPTGSARVEGAIAATATAAAHAILEPQRVLPALGAAARWYRHGAVWVRDHLASLLGVEAPGTSTEVPPAA